MNELESDENRFPLTWIGGDLGDYRLCDRTYCTYELGSLPPLPEGFDGGFQWLSSQPSPLDFDERFRAGWTHGDGLGNWPEYARQRNAELLANAARLGVRIPDAFFRFMNDVALLTRLRSPTDCYFTCPVDLIPDLTSRGGHFVPFYSDSQHCWLWYLYIDTDQRCVVVAGDVISEPLDDDYWLNDRGRVRQCASSFESFIYRLWIENEIWYRLHIRDQPLTAEMLEYVHFYKSDG